MAESMLAIARMAVADHEARLVLADAIEEHAWWTREHGVAVHWAIYRPSYKIRPEWDGPSVCEWFRAGWMLEPDSVERFARAIVTVLEGLWEGPQVSADQTTKGPQR